ncbi:MAG: uL22 family ribosomal protein [Vampirovibrionales bacterium]
MPCTPCASCHRAAEVILKNLRAAVANAEVKFGDSVDLSQMKVSAIMVDEAQAYRRFKPRAQGRVYKIEKPTAHLMVEVALAAKGE